MDKGYAAPIWMTFKLVAGFFAGDSAATNEKVEPSSLIPQHFSGDDAFADIHEPAPAAAKPLPHALVPANDIRRDKPAPARESTPPSCLYAPSALKKRV